LTGSVGDLRTEARHALNELYSRTPEGNHGLTMGAKATRLLALLELEPEYGSTWRRKLEERGALIAGEERVPELYSYHLFQAFVELFNEDPEFRARAHAHVERLVPKDRR
jgi:mannose/cellobiose epimerase-like protein (N-acyl-D-glucosamine 2-epimerase family)